MGQHPPLNLAFESHVKNAMQRAHWRWRKGSGIQGFKIVRLQKLVLRSPSLPGL